MGSHVPPAGPLTAPTVSLSRLGWLYPTAEVLFDGCIMVLAFLIFWGLFYLLGLTFTAS